jgi:hypothetical protein
MNRIRDAVTAILQHTGMPPAGSHVNKRVETDLTEQTKPVGSGVRKYSKRLPVNTLLAR